LIIKKKRRDSGIRVWERKKAEYRSQRDCSKSKDTLRTQQSRAARDEIQTDDKKGKYIWEARTRGGMVKGKKRTKLRGQVKKRVTTVEKICKKGEANWLERSNMQSMLVGN